MSTGWAVRNFFQTGIIEQLRQEFDIWLVTTPSIYENLTRLEYDRDIEITVLEDLPEPMSWRLFRELKKKLYMESRGSSTEKIWEEFVRRPLYQKIGGLLIKAIVRVFNPHVLLSWTENVDFVINNSAQVDSLFLKFKPSLFFSTHASTFFEERILHGAIRNKVPTVFMVLSWDHLSSKVVLSHKYRSVYVWNSLTKSEILKTCRAYPEGRIKIVGVPQYDIYGERPAVSYGAWCRSYRLDPARRTILFSTMPQVRHEQQHLILEGLLQAIEDRQIDGNCQVLVKCHPFDNEGKYDHLLDRYPVGICRSTLAPGLAHSQWFPSVEEMVIGRDALYFCDININIFSTVTLEAAYFDKPIVHIAFDPKPVHNRIPCREYYQFEHFKKITEMQASTMAYSADGLYGAINEYFRNPAHRAEQRLKLVEEYFTVVPGAAAGNVVNELIHDFNAAN